MATKIDWTDSTWNPVTGCTKYSQGCDNCYAARMAPRLQGMKNQKGKYRNGFTVTCHPHELEKASKFSAGKRVFVNSMGDLFHEDVPFSFIAETFAEIGRSPDVTFQILTKRAERMLDLAPHLPWHGNVWMGVTIEADEYAYRAELLKQAGAAIKFVSLEPLLGPVPSLQLEGLDWVIIGGETGPRPRPMEASWVQDIRDCAVALGIPFFFKQWGGRNSRARGKMVQGRLWQQFP